MTITKFEPEVEEYLNLKKKDTAGTYASGFRKFLEFYHEKYGDKAGFSHLLDRIFDEFKKPPREQKRIAEVEANEFILWLKDHKNNKGQNFSNNAIRLYFAAMQDFLRYKNVALSAEFLNVPAPNGKKENEKHEWTKDQVREFVNAAPTYRDKAIACAIFQSGLGVAEICALDYGDVQAELESGKLPICLKLIRQKTDVKFKTFFGRDTVYYLKLYLATRGKLNPTEPLFAKERVRGGEARISDSAIQESFSVIAKDLPFIKQNGGYNGARPHSLRAAFETQLYNKIDPVLRNFWMGHEIGAQNRAYLQMPCEEMRSLYMGVEKFLSIEKTSQEEMNEKVKGTSIYSEKLDADVNALKAKVESLPDVKALKEKVEYLEEVLSSQRQMIRDLEPILDSFLMLSDSPKANEIRKQLDEQRRKNEEEEQKWRAELMKADNEKKEKQST